MDSVALAEVFVEMWQILLTMDEVICGQAEVTDTESAVAAKVAVWVGVTFSSESKDSLA